jgi:hypothetical protein
MTDLGGSVAFSSDGNKVLSSSRGCHVALWRANMFERPGGDGRASSDRIDGDEARELRKKLSK